MKKLLFGTAGIPISAKNRSSVEGIRRVKELGLSCMELEFVHGVKMAPEAAKLLGERRKELDIELTAHAPYYINLNSHDKAKKAASKARILKTARIAWLAGATSITFHAAFYMKEDPGKVFVSVSEQLKDIIATLRDEGNKIWIRPELTGKPTQFGDIKELLKLSKWYDQVLPCIDYAHYFARYNGKYNTYNDFSSILEQIEKELGKQALSNMHIHVSGIAYGEKGEKNHLILEESELKYKELVKTWKNFNIKGIVICESPNLEDDALLLKTTYEEV